MMTNFQHLWVPWINGGLSKPLPIPREIYFPQNIVDLTLFGTLLAIKWQQFCKTFLDCKLNLSERSKMKVTEWNRRGGAGSFSCKIYLSLRAGCVPKKVQFVTLCTNGVEKGKYVAPNILHLSFNENKNIICKTERREKLKIKYKMQSVTCST